MYDTTEAILTHAEVAFAAVIKQVVLGADARFEYSFPSKDKLVIERKTSRYANFKEGEEITVTFGQYDVETDVDPQSKAIIVTKDIWYASHTEHWQTSNIDLAIAAYIQRLVSDRPERDTNTSQSVEEIFERK